MKQFDIHRYDMLARVSAFGTAHRDLFPASALGGRMFAALATAVRQLNGRVTSEASGSSAAREGVLSKKAARAALREALETIAKTARALALDTPALNGKFRLPSRQSDYELATTARMYVAEAAPLAGSFVSHGLPSTFMSDLRARLDAFERAAQEHFAARETRVIARAGIDSAMKAALSALQRLDAIVPNRLRNEPELRAAWTNARRVMRTRTGGDQGAPTLPPPTIPPPPPATHPAAA
jgi:hypothetical protein